MYTVNSALYCNVSGRIVVLLPLIKLIDWLKLLTNLHKTATSECKHSSGRWSSVGPLRNERQDRLKARVVATADHFEHQM